MYSPGVGSSPKGRNDFHRAVSAKRYWNRFVVVFSCLNNLLLDSLPLLSGYPQAIEANLSPQHLVNTSQHHPAHNHPGNLRATLIQHTFICRPVTWNPPRPKSRFDQIVTQMLVCSSSLRPSMNKDGLSTTNVLPNIGSFLTLSGSSFYSGSKPENGLGNTVCILRE